jgi:hypothetical protein
MSKPGRSTTTAGRPWGAPERGGSWSTEVRVRFVCWKAPIRAGRWSGPHDITVARRTVNAPAPRRTAIRPVSMSFRTASGYASARPGVACLAAQERLVDYRPATDPSRQTLRPRARRNRHPAIAAAQPVAGGRRGRSVGLISRPWLSQCGQSSQDRATLRAPCPRAACSCSQEPELGPRSRTSPKGGDFRIGRSPCG